MSFLTDADFRCEFRSQRVETRVRIVTSANGDITEEREGRRGRRGRKGGREGGVMSYGKVKQLTVAKYTRRKNSSCCLNVQTLIIGS